MNLISEQDFYVVYGEAINIYVAPAVLEAGSLAMTLDGEALLPVNDELRSRYSFVVTKAAGMTHVCAVAANFGAGMPDEVEYEFIIEGSYGGSEKFYRRMSGQAHDFVLRFHVEEEVSREEDSREDVSEGDPPIIVQGGDEYGPDGISPTRPWD
ncbi:MAG TPA: hypothetical protein VJ842_10355 [Pyrinomonadaceae bacterium]|nr:hypothetical protein [Pyrinomonadaceae bacterium]